STYAAERQPTLTTDARGFTWETIYDGYGRPKESRDPLGNQTQLEYDTAGSPSEARALDGLDALLARETTTYDLLGRPLTSGRWLLGQTPRELREQYTWNPASELVSMTDPLGRVSRWERDAAERVTATQDALGNRNELGFDEAGNVVSLSEVELVPGGNAETRTTTFAHDALGRQVWRADALGNTERWEWDAHGAVSRSIDAEGNATLSEVDALGRQTRLTRPEGLVEIFGYDRASRLTSYADAQNHTTLWQRDVLGRLERLQLPDGGAYLYERDAAGNPTKITDPNGSEMVQSFDARGLLTSRQNTLAAGVVGPTLETFIHDGLGRLMTATSGTITSRFTWDSLSRLLSEETLGRKIEHQLDDAGNAIELHYPSGLRLLQSFDALDRLQALGRQTAEEFEPRAAYTFRGADRVHSQALAAQLRGARSYDAAGRPTNDQIGLMGATQPAFQEQQAWNRAGSRPPISRLDSNGSGCSSATMVPTDFCKRPHPEANPIVGGSATTRSTTKPRGSVTSEGSSRKASRCHPKARAVTGRARWAACCSVGMPTAT
ncbi:MAG: RHS repeat protein, partial [Thermoanaerobaculia bacterium]|nr:RHS repeat protein [Thermoanaerobaculia bacterium]